MTFSPEYFDELMPKLTQDERDAVDELLELVNVIIEDFMSVKSESVLSFRLASLSDHFVVFMGQLIEISMDHGFDFAAMMQDLARITKSNTDDIYELDVIEPASRVELAQVETVMSRTIDVTLRMMAESDLYDGETKEIRDDLFGELRMYSGRASLLRLAVGIACSDFYDDVSEETIPLLIESLVRHAGYLGNVLGRFDQLVTPDKVKLTPIDELFEEPNDE